MINISLSQETYDRIIRAVEITESQNNPSVQAALFASQQAIYAKVTGFADEDEKRIAKAIEVVWDDTEFEFRELTEDEGDPLVYDTDEFESSSATVFAQTSIVSKSEMSTDDVFLLQYYPNLSETEEWLVVETGGTNRVYIEVTTADENTTPASGLCSVWPSYSKFANGDDPTETDAFYFVPNSTSNALADGDTGYATKEIDDGDATYIIEAYLLV